MTTDKTKKPKNTIHIPLQNKLESDGDLRRARELEALAVEQWLNRRGNKIKWHPPGEGREGEIVEKFKRGSWGKKKKKKE